MNSVVSVLALMLLAALGALVYRLRSHPQEWEDLMLNRFRRWRAFWTTRRLVKWVCIPLASWALVFCMSNRAELEEAYERIQCGGDACPALPAQELRWRFIKSYLHYMLNQRKPSSDGCCYEQLVLLPANLDSHHLAESLENATLFTTLTTNTLPLETHDDIDALTKNALTKYPSIAGISRFRRNAVIIPMHTIQPIRMENVNVDTGYTKRYLHQEVMRRIGPWERLRGYGKYFFEITEYWDIDLSCCDEGGQENEIRLIARRKNIEQIQRDPLKTRVTAASDRGKILLWEDEHAENSDNLTPILFFTKSNF